MKKHLRIAAILFSVLMIVSAFSSCSLSTEGIELNQALQTESTTLPDPVLLEMEELSLREKVGLLFAVTPEALGANAQKQGINDGMREFYSSFPAGMIILFADNISDPAQLTEFTSSIHSLGAMIGIDEEGGSVARIGKNPAFSVEKIQDMEKIAASGDTQKAYQVGSTIGGYLSQYGIDIDFAPVADVNTNPANTVIGRRAFGSDPRIASEMVASAVRGFASTGVMSCLKHFPGHGDTKEDSHKGSAVTNKSWDEMLSCEMLPFKAGIAEGADMVMVSHISAPSVTGDDIPSSLSHCIITEKLRGELGFDGVIITDSMSMGAITQNYSSGEAAVMSLLAGADIILMPKDYESAFNAVLAAVEDGRISPERLDESVYRILALRSRCGGVNG